jgi:hypothetical protein
MVLAGLNDLVLKIHDHCRLSASDKAFVRDALPQVLGTHRAVESFREYRHPAGVMVRGAPSRTFIKAHALLAAKRVFGGKGFVHHPLYRQFEEDLTLGIMRSNFEGGSPKGFYCCKVC